MQPIKKADRSKPFVSMPSLAYELARKNRGRATRAKRKGGSRKR